MTSLDTLSNLNLERSLIPADAPKALLETARLLLASKFTHLACGVVFIFDSVIVFDEEYRLICTCSGLYR